MKKYFFKHIIKIGNKYYIRKWEFLVGWTLLDREEDYWWYNNKTYSGFATLEEAKQRLIEYKNPEKLYYQ